MARDATHFRTVKERAAGAMEHNDHRSLLRGRLLEHFGANGPALGIERNGGSAERWFGGRRIVSAEKHRRRDKRRCR
jgi:hypothetical protein